ncbi:hypothetical protein AUJ10_03895 [Candidatus Pacearchaeota archaeon CG1_02_31_27]|nr:MAG: hypothetical protein AUJ10_03895 [Candidatus Pacearchaeota archaeon CG1_02_31_27]
MRIFHTTIQFKTKEELDFIDLTDEIIAFVKKSQIKNGLVNIQCLHTSAAIFVNENEPLLFEDIKNHLERIAPKTLKYNHDDFTIRTVNVCPGECVNGHSHCKAIHLATNVTLNLINGKLQHGQYQRVLFAELDGSRERKVQIQIIGT